jgi:hypothetical protein
MELKVASVPHIHSIHVWAQTMDGLLADTQYYRTYITVWELYFLKSNRK